MQRLGFGQDDAQGPLVELVPGMNPEVADRLPVGAKDGNFDKVGPEETSKKFFSQSSKPNAAGTRRHCGLAQHAQRFIKSSLFNFVLAVVTTSKKLL